MRAVVLTGHGHEHAHVTRALVEAVGQQLVGLVLESQPPTSGSSALRRYPPTRILERLITKAGRRLLRHRARTERALKAIIGPANPVTVHRTHQTASVNAPATRSWIAELEPTHVFVYGTGLVRSPASLASCVLNLHTGLSPFYRGADAEFWPLYDWRPELVGATVHECTAAIDGGDIYARACARLQPTDDVFAAFARCVHVGANLYAGVARRLADGEVIALLPQIRAQGKCYRFTDRTLVHDLRMAWRTRTGRLRRVLRTTPEPLCLL